MSRNNRLNREARTVRVMKPIVLHTTTANRVAYVPNAPPFLNMHFVRLKNVRSIGPNLCAQNVLFIVIALK
jgi:hypothetical protein